MGKTKLKPNKGLLKRVRITGRKKVKFSRSFGTHLMSHMTGKQVRQLRRRRLVKAGDIGRIQKMLHMRLVAGNRGEPPAAKPAD